MNPKQAHWDSMYEKPPEEIPWEITEPPSDLKAFLQTYSLPTSAQVLDLACGTGNYSIYLAQKGYNVTGLDFSEEALKVARERSVATNVQIDFMWGDALELSSVLHKKFDFIFIYRLFNHIPLDQTEEFAKQFDSLLNLGGKILLVCDSDKDPVTEGRREIVGKFDNTMYYRSADEIRSAFKNLKEINYTEGRTGKRLNHISHSFIFENTK